MKTNNIISKMVEEYENLMKITEIDKESGLYIAYDKYRAYDNFKELIFQLYQNYKKGEVQKIKIRRAMMMIELYFNIFDDDIIQKEIMQKLQMI